VTDLTVVLATERPATIRGMLAGGNSGQRGYLQVLAQELIDKGYVHATTVRVLVYFGESDLHAVLTWKPPAPPVLVINDNNLAGGGFSPPPGTTPFPEVPKG
jgi:hypothetical protein